MRKLLLVSLLLTSMLSFGQNWSLFTDSSNYTFNQSEFHSIRVDSVRIVNNDSIYFMNKIVNDSLLDYFTSLHSCTKELVLPNFVGETIVKRNDSIFLQNYQDSVLLLLPKAKLGQSWKFTSDTANYFARVDSVYLDSIIRLDSLPNVADSMKLIRFEARDTNNNVVNHPLSAKRLVISKNYGLIEIFDIYRTPHKESFYHNVFGQSNFVLKRVLYNFQRTIGELNDFVVGDEYHFTTEEFDTGTGIPQPANYTNAEVTAKVTSTNGDTITYTFKEITERNVTRVDNSGSMPRLVTSTSYPTRTYSKKILNLSKTINRGILEPKFYFDATYNFSRTSLFESTISNYNNRLKVSTNIDVDTIFVDTCWNTSFNNITSIQIEGVCYFEDEYKVYNGNSVYRRWNTLIYYKKGTETWGNPRIVTGLEGITTEKKQLTVYPNPTTGRINIPLLPEMKEIEVFDLQGRRVSFVTQSGVEVSTNSDRSLQAAKQSSEEETINADRLSRSSLAMTINGKPGIYLLKITMQNGSVRTSKIIKQ